MSKPILVAVLALIAGCASSPPVNPNVVAANREDRAQALCVQYARAYNLRVSSTEQPVQLDSRRYEIGMRTRDAGGVVQRRCVADVDYNRASFL